MRNYSNNVAREFTRLTAGCCGESTTISLGVRPAWIFPEDTSIDLAVLPFAPNQAIVDYDPIPSSMLATAERIKSTSIDVGDPVIFAGLFVQMPGFVKLQPIVRQGIIAMMPDEPVMTTLNKPGQLYLADVHVFGGNSGSPMFVNLGGARNGMLSLGPPQYVFLGVVSGYEYEDVNFNLTPATTYSGTAGANSGVTSVVPAEQLGELLNSPTLQKQRDEVIKTSRGQPASKD